MRSTTRLLALGLTLWPYACSTDAPSENAEPGVADIDDADEQGPQARPAPAPAAPAPAVEKPPGAQPAADPNEACGQMILVAYRGADKAPHSIKRDKSAALARASELLDKLEAGADFAELARAESDAPSSGARGGTFGTYEKAKWPELHMALRDPLFTLEVGALYASPIDAPYGYALLTRCPIDKARVRHILVRYKGGKNADKDIKRTKQQAAAHAATLRERIEKGEAFDKIAREASDDSSRERGGELGMLGRGLLTEPFERVLFSLSPGELAPVVETEFGFHVIERMHPE